ncbi:MAG: type II toxin-antitoxin system HicB family antitoxin [Fimbriimonas ginsengisoli]|uniref:Type II toxin-antitoxin system HicB family antitoxin n=1 Tax=Fimbriimonas ginsengisoli TaxID=1005039 RepID=A0A931PVV6_FIMGI|nr:type II toxin-antitoxin system HicB family antitoxin [Fimbriimonas ginsengisoli]
MKYLVVFEQGEQGQWGAYVPDLPGCTAVGTTKTEARELIAESVRMWVETARAKGWPVPAPNSSAIKIAV